MTIWSRIRSWLRAIARRSRMENEMDAELRFHIEAFAEDLVRSGVPSDEALRRARIRFGRIARAKEACPGGRGANLLATPGQDPRSTPRVPRQTPRFSTVAGFTLALLVGAKA